MEAYRIVSADSHVFEPANLWESRIDKPFREKAPRFIPNHDGKDGTYLVADGIVPKRMATVAAVNMKGEELPGFNQADHSDLRPGGWDPAERLKDQEIDGVVAEVLYGTYTMYLFGITDGPFLEAIFRAYNDWVAEYCAYAPDRLAGLAVISMYDVRRAVAELERTAKLGMRGAMIPCIPPEGMEYSDPEFAPFWSAAEAHDMPISLHILTSNRQSHAKPRFDGATFGPGMYMSLPHELQLTLVDMICRGVLERHPKLKLVSAEGDAGWIAHFLSRLNHAQERYAHLNNLHLKLTPTEYFHRQVYATFIDDRVGVATREFVGVDNLMWSSDYPHTDSCWPHSRKVIEGDFAGVPAEHREKMVCTNAAKLYRIGGA